MRPVSQVSCVLALLVAFFFMPPKQAQAEDMPSPERVQLSPERYQGQVVTFPNTTIHGRVERCEGKLALFVRSARDNGFPCTGSFPFVVSEALADKLGDHLDENYKYFVTVTGRVVHDSFWRDRYVFLIDEITFGDGRIVAGGTSGIPSDIAPPARTSRSTGHGRGLQRLATDVRSLAVVQEYHFVDHARYFEGPCRELQGMFGRSLRAGVECRATRKPCPKDEGFVIAASEETHRCVWDSCPTAAVNLECQ